MLLADEGQVVEGGMHLRLLPQAGTEGRAVHHLIALRLAYAEQEARAAPGARPAAGVTVETRTFASATRPARRSIRSRSSAPAQGPLGPRPASPALADARIRQRGRARAPTSPASTGGPRRLPRRHGGMIPGRKTAWSRRQVSRHVPNSAIRPDPASGGPSSRPAASRLYVDAQLVERGFMVQRRETDRDVRPRARTPTRNRSRPRRRSAAS